MEQQYHILVVDDDQAIVEVIDAILSSEGYRVQSSLNGACLQHLDSDPPDLILLDVLLQGENGQELCRGIKKREQTKQIPVILISAHLNTQNAIASCGADGFLAKPFNIIDLLQLVSLKLNPA